MKPPDKPAHIRRLDAAIQAERERREVAETAPPRTSSRALDIEWVYVEVNVKSSASTDFLSGSWTPGKSYRVLGDSRSVNAWRYDVVLYVEDNDKRVHVIHMDHVRVAEGGDDDR